MEIDGIVIPIEVEAAGADAIAAFVAEQQAAHTAPAPEVTEES